ncbi:MAG: hypothetical protein IFNCLDLE_02634 [Ignavibacteriaceae bacterium]|nr:hypothetical protein [Ignavibacteriaceae bacterium]
MAFTPSGLAEETAAQVGREGAIQLALKKQLNDIEELLHAVDELSSKLRPIMSPKPENQKTQEVEPGPDRDIDAYILDAIQGRSRAVRTITSMVKRLSAQVDL